MISSCHLKQNGKDSKAQFELIGQRTLRDGTTVIGKKKLSRQDLIDDGQTESIILSVSGVRYAMLRRTPNRGEV
jgi:hypothetical protein